MKVVAANGPAIDGVAGATVTTKAVQKAVAAALGVELAEAAHGTKCFTEAVAVDAAK